MATLDTHRQHFSWDKFLASIPDTDLDLLISAGEKMQHGEAILNPRELDACLRWYPHLDILPANLPNSRQN